jgi:tryptophan synthase beta chain
MSASVSALYDAGHIEAVAVPQLGTFEAAMTFARTEGIIPAPESAHAIKAAVDEALDAKELGEERVIVFNLSGHGYFDLTAYDEYLGGELQNYEYPQEAIEDALKKLPKIQV